MTVKCFSHVFYRIFMHCIDYCKPIGEHKNGDGMGIVDTLKKIRFLY